MSWLDRVLAVPVVGVRFRPWFRTTSDYVRALEPFFEALAPDGNAEVTAQVAELEFNNKRGFKGQVTAHDLVLSFSYKGEVKETPGAVPQLHYPVPVERFTTLLSEVETQFAAAARALLGSDRRPVVRIGIVAQTRLERQGLPPGAQRFLGHLSRPWEAGLQECEAQLSAVLGRSEGIVQRCHHRLGFSDAPPVGAPTGVVVLNLDWQQVFEPMRPMTADEIVRSVETCRRDALAYFERFGRGELGYAT
jgi:hypothetical protein